MCGQNPRHVFAGHPRLMLNDTVADTWSPGMTRLAAVTQRVMTGGKAAAMADVAALKAGITSATPQFGDSSNEDANLNLLLNYAFAYAVYHKAGDNAAANVFASRSWAAMTAVNGTPYTITSITADSNGLATVTLCGTRQWIRDRRMPCQTGWCKLGRSAIISPTIS